MPNKQSKSLKKAKSLTVNAVAKRLPKEPLSVLAVVVAVAEVVAVVQKRKVRAVQRKRVLVKRVVQRARVRVKISKLSIGLK